MKIYFMYNKSRDEDKLIVNVKRILLFKILRGYNGFKWL